MRQSGAESFDLVAKWPQKRDSVKITKPRKVTKSTFRITGQLLDIRLADLKEGVFVNWITPLAWITHQKSSNVFRLGFFEFLKKNHSFESPYRDEDTRSGWYLIKNVDNLGEKSRPTTRNPGVNPSITDAIEWKKQKISAIFLVFPLLIFVCGVITMLITRKLR